MDTASCEDSDVGSWKDLYQSTMCEPDLKKLRERNAEAGAAIARAMGDTLFIGFPKRAGVLVVLLIAFLSGCGQETVNISDTTPPQVVSTIPARGATGVPPNTRLSATFSEAMNCVTLQSPATTFTVSGPGATVVTGTVNCAGTVATLTPATPLAPNTVFTATITTGATDLAGNSLASNFVWSFRTVPAPTLPAVISTTPANGATGVPINQALTATFSEAMTPATINAATYTLIGPGGVAITGAVSYVVAGSVATFTPTVNLASSTVYTATITTGAMDLVNTALTDNFIWTFTTAAAPDTTKPTIISTIPANTATNVPFNQAVSATFSEAMNSATINSTTFTLHGPGETTVAGLVTYAIGNTATFTPAANLAPSTLFTAMITTGTTDLAGNALASNFVWSFTTGVAPDTTAPEVVSTIPATAATGVPLNQAVSATFSEAMDPLTITTATFQLMEQGGSPIAGTVAYDPINLIATLTPSTPLIGGTTYIATVTTGATDLAGNPLATNYVWIFTTADTTPPTVTETTPANGVTGVPFSQVLSATFSEAMNCVTLQSPATTFTVSGPGATVVTGTVNCAGTVATLTPATPLAPNTVFTATITTGATDLAGNSLASNFVWSFRTVPAPTLPAVISTTPANGATGVPINQALTATFSEAMTPATINAATYTLIGPGGVAITGAVSYVVAGSVATFTPTVNLASSTVYTATITTGAMDLVNTALTDNFIWTFTTAAAPDTTKPTIISTIPANTATNVPFNQAVSATFSEAMNSATINSTTFTLHGPGETTVAGLVTYAIGNTATFTPAANLAPSTLFTAMITTGTTDLAGNALASNFVWSFTTGVAPDTTAPEVVSTIPATAATGVPLNQAVSATFSEAMDPLTITTATFQLMEQGGSPIAGTVAYDPINLIATLTPSTPLIGGTTYIATVTTGATDLAGNPLGFGGTANPWSFTTAAVVILPPVDLGTASLFGGFGAGAGMTNQGISTVINGNIATTGASTLITGFHDSGTGCIYTETPLNIGTVNGAIDTSPPPPTIACPDEGTAVTSAIAAKVAEDAATAYGTLVAFPGGLDVSTCPGCGGGSTGELGGRTLVSGVYKSAPGSYGITSGDLTLDGQGDINAFWVFQMATTLTVGTPSAHRSVILVNGAHAKNVFWQVGTAATINGILGGGTMVGTIISQAGVSISTAGVAAVTTINGRVLALSGPITMVNAVINVPAP
jgi:hypothetical protein